MRLPFLRFDVSKTTATTPISLSDSSFTSEIGADSVAGAILIGLRLVGCDVVAESVHRYTQKHQNSTFTEELLGQWE